MNSIVVVLKNISKPKIAIERIESKSRKRSSTTEYNVVPRRISYSLDKKYARIVSPNFDGVMLAKVSPMKYKIIASLSEISFSVPLSMNFHRNALIENMIIPKGNANKRYGICPFPIISKV